MPPSATRPQAAARPRHVRPTWQHKVLSAKEGWWVDGWTDGCVLGCVGRLWVSECGWNSGPAGVPAVVPLVRLLIITVKGFGTELIGRLFQYKSKYKITLSRNREDTGAPATNGSTYLLAASKHAAGRHAGKQTSRHTTGCCYYCTRTPPLFAYQNSANKIDHRGQTT